MVQEEIKLKDFSYTILNLALVAILFGGANCAILVEGIMGNIHVKFF